MSEHGDPKNDQTEEATEAGAEAPHALTEEELDQIAGGYVDMPAPPTP